MKTEIDKFLLVILDLINAFVSAVKGALDFKMRWKGVFDNMFVLTKCSVLPNFVVVSETVE
jgi:hypothetical protein